MIERTLSFVLSWSSDGLYMANVGSEKISCVRINRLLDCMDDLKWCLNDYVNTESLIDYGNLVIAVRSRDAVLGINAVNGAYEQWLDLMNPTVDKKMIGVNVKVDCNAAAFAGPDDANIYSFHSSNFGPLLNIICMSRCISAIVLPPKVERKG